ncbi:diguanylate cyclase domain-containing protein [Mycolicibacterium aubagnense]|uniref:diguanylate cyclase domain-containing protein n=1 Tax=Mycolicibacterium aubagnense TaxID=319707 RepID=UPI0010FDE224|nr:diguanylate cyclase [Mycolicibacterium aubagnense]TLH48583.1 diguanylate cyclase [Mycolicibacterium aubagnense]
MTDSSPTVEPVALDPDGVRFRVLVDHSPDAICVHEAGRVVYLNPAGVRWIAAESAEQLIGHPITEFVHADSVPGMLARLATLRELGDATEPAEAALLRFDGKILDVEIISILTTWEGRPAHQVVFRDITAQKAAQATLRYQAALVEHVSDAIIGTAADGTVTAWNPAAETIYQRPAELTLGLPIAAAVGAALDPAAIVAAGGVHNTTHHTAEGRALAIRVSAAAMESGYVLVCSDRTALRRAEQHFQTVVESLHRGVMVIDPLGRIESANPAALRILGCPGDLSSSVDLADFFPGHGPDGQLRLEAEQPVAITRRTGRSVNDELLFIDDSDGRRIWLSVSTCLLDPADREGSGVLLSFEDVTAQHLASERLRHDATHDTLTDLPNRAWITDQITGALAGVGEQPLAAVIFIDLDQLKEVNDTLGHHAGDAVIRICARRFTGVLRARDTVARIGGDEFLILIGAPASVEDLEQIANRLHATLADPIRVDNRLVHASASIGIAATAPGETRAADEILRHADSAMYQAKTSGRGQTRFWTAENDLAV